MHKSKGHTLEKAAIDLGTSEATAGLTFTYLSHAKRLVDPLVEPMPFDRLSKLSDKSTLKIRLEEEVRLKALADETLLRHGVRPPWLVAVDRVLVMISLAVFAFGGGVGRECVLKLMRATRRAIVQKITTHTCSRCQRTLVTIVTPQS